MVVFRYQPVREPQILIRIRTPDGIEFMKLLEPWLIVYLHLEKAVETTEHEEHAEREGLRLARGST